jgi:hypothetical protein
MEGGTVWHKFKRGQPIHHSSQILFWSLGVSISKLRPTACPPFKMAAVTKNRYFFNCPLLLYYKSKWAQILTAATWPRTIPAKFGLIWLSGFRGKDLNMKVYKHTMTDSKWWQKLTWPLGEWLLLIPTQQFFNFSFGWLCKLGIFW